MRTFLLTWNPDSWTWNEDNIHWWRFNSKKARAGDRFFLMRLGVAPKGIFASGKILGEPRLHDNRYFVDIDYDVRLDPSREQILELPRLQEMAPTYNWTPFPSGVEIPTGTAEALAAEWGRFLKSKTLSNASGAIERRYARLTWNSHGWVMPSGRNGKSNNKSTHEGKYGFGHEEWLFDMGKLVDGYHYGFLEPIHKSIGSYVGNEYGIWLYTIDGQSKTRYWVGDIRKVTVIGKDEKDHVRQVYQEKGWLQEMKEQLMNYGIDKSNSSPKFKVSFPDFNIRFDPKDLFIKDQYVALPSTHPIYRISRYTFGNFTNDYHFQAIEKKDFSFMQALTEASTLSGGSSNYIREPKEVEIRRLHIDISNALTKHLVQKYGRDYVRQEHPYGKNSIDIVVKDHDRLAFYEIKTYISPKTSIRDALGQLLEYCYFPDRENAAELIIVSQHPADQEIVTYMKFLREKFKLPLFYCSFEMKTGLLSERA